MQLLDGYEQRENKHYKIFEEYILKMNSKQTQCTTYKSIKLHLLENIVCITKHGESKIRVFLLLFLNGSTLLSGCETVAIIHIYWKGEKRCSKKWANSINHWLINIFDDVIQYVFVFTVGNIIKCLSCHNTFVICSVTLSYLSSSSFSLKAVLNTFILSTN